MNNIQSPTLLSGCGCKELFISSRTLGGSLPNIRLYTLDMILLMKISMVILLYSVKINAVSGNLVLFYSSNILSKCM
jgi:hypothetical protein